MMRSNIPALSVDEVKLQKLYVGVDSFSLQSASLRKFDVNSFGIDVDKKMAKFEGRFMSVNVFFFMSIQYLVICCYHIDILFLSSFDYSF